MTTEKPWMRPQDIKTFRTSDPKKMLGKFLLKPVYKEWTEDVQDSNRKTLSVTRRQLLLDRGEVTADKASEIMFYIQAGEIDDVELSDVRLYAMNLKPSSYFIAYSLELERGSLECTVKDHYVCYAQNINQAIIIACEFGQMYRSFGGDVKVNRVVTLDAELVPDDHACIPENLRKPAWEDKDYFRVTVRNEWIENATVKKRDRHYIIAANDVGEAKERIALMIDIAKAEAKEIGNDNFLRVHRTIRKAVPFEVDCVVPREYSKLYVTKPADN